MLELTITTPPAALPVARETLARHLRLAEGFEEPSPEEALLDRYLAAATAEVEARTQTALVRRGCRLRVAAWEADGRLTLPVGPVAAIQSGEIDGTPLSGLSLGPGPTRQRLSRGGAPLPAIPAGGAATLEFEAGFGPGPADIPADLAEAVLRRAAHLYAERTGPVPPEIDRLLAPWRPIRL